MIGAILAGAQVGLGLYDAYKGHKQAKKEGRRADEQLALMKEQQLKNNEITQAEYDNFTAQRQAAQDSFDQNYKPIEEDLAQQVLEGEDVESAARRAEGEFTGQYDRSLEASRREQRRQGISPNSSAAASFEEDTAFNRARGSATAATNARRTADDQNFIRKATFLNSGQGLRDRAMQQFGGRFGSEANRYAAGVHRDNAAQSAASSRAGLESLGQIAGAAAGMAAGNPAAAGGIMPRARTGDASKPNLNMMSAEQGAIKPGTSQGVHGAIASKTRVNP